MNALDSVRLILEARAQAKRWAMGVPVTYFRVCNLQPRHLLGRYTPMEWAVTVAAFRLEHETPVQAAQRLATYMDLHKERHNTTPTLASVQKRAADRHLKETR